MNLPKLESENPRITNRFIKINKYLGIKIKVVEGYIVHANIDFKDGYFKYGKGYMDITFIEGIYKKAKVSKEDKFSFKEGIGIAVKKVCLSTIVKLMKEYNFTYNSTYDQYNQLFKDIYRTIYKFDTINFNHKNTKEYKMIEKIIENKKKQIQEFNYLLS